MTERVLRSEIAGSAKASARRRAALAVTAALLFGACVEIEGGAVEVPWAVFALDGRGAINDCSCTDPAIAYVRLKLAAPPATPNQPDPCASSDACRFECGRKTGATPFTIPPGFYMMSIQPETADGTSLAPLVKLPAPTGREVVRGAPTELDAFEIEATCAADCHGADVDMPCARN